MADIIIDTTPADADAYAVYMIGGLDRDASGVEIDLGDTNTINADVLLQGYQSFIRFALFGGITDSDSATIKTMPAGGQFIVTDAAIKAESSDLMPLGNKNLMPMVWCSSNGRLCFKPSFKAIVRDFMHYLENDGVTLGDSDKLFIEIDLDVIPVYQNPSEDFSMDNATFTLKIEFSDLPDGITPMDWISEYPYGYWVNTTSDTPGAI